MSTVTTLQTPDFLEELVHQYLDALNRQDTDAVMALMHPGAAYYDAFWLESHVGKNLREALLDAWDEEPFWHELLGEVVPFDGGVAFRYNARELAGKENGNLLFQGAEVLIIEDGKILTVTAYWISPYRVDLKEVGEIARQRHGVIIHT